MEKPEESSTTISFTVNGKLYRVSDVSIGTTLNHWLRSTAHLTGTKQMCYEGGCGSCVVMVTRPDPVKGEDISFAVNSCLFPLLSLDGYHVVTTEGLIAEDGSYHSIQQSVAQFNATQCGYCTPGFVMTMYSMLKNNPTPTQEEIEKEFDGNICRCTGFRPILDAMKFFASDADPKLLRIAEKDIEDLQTCRSSQTKCAANSGSSCAKTCGRYKADGCVIPQQKWDHLLTSGPMITVSDSRLWLRPTTLQDLQNAVVQNANSRIKFVVGNTSTGVFKQDNDFDVYIDTKLVPELYKISDTLNNDLEIGANVTLSSLISNLKTRSTESVTFDVIAKHLQKVANVPVRNVGSWVGNIMMKHRHNEFPSDVFTLLTAYFVKLVIWDSKTGNTTTVRLDGDNGILSIDMTGKIVLSALIPKQGNTGKSHASSYKVMPRSQNAHAYVNAAFFANISEGKVMNSPSLVFGGISKTFVHAVQTEIYMIGRDVNLQKTLSGALETLEKEVVPEVYSALDSSAKYRKSLVLGLFYKFYLTLCNPKVISSVNSSASSDLSRPVSTASQNYSTNASMYPVSQPIPKVTALKQASGEAKYISDFSPLNDELFATFVTSKVANADIDEIQVDSASDMPGVVAIITANDLPSNLKNTYMQPPWRTQPIIADTHVGFVGQPLAIVVADNRGNAKKAAEAVTVTYKNLETGIFDIQTGIEEQSFFEGPGIPVVIGDVPSAEKTCDHLISGTVNIGSQYHFYMETQICRVTPTEDGFDVETATQFQDNIMGALSYIFNWDCNRFNITTGRIGGSYGGKAYNSNICAAGAAVASYITGKPVRMHPGLSECMETYGRRAAYVANYTVGFNADGMLKCIEGTYYSDSGVSSNDSDVFHGGILQFADSGYHCDNWKITPKWVKTNVASNAWCRAPTSAELCWIMEIMMEHIASYLKQDPFKIKQMNLLKKDELNLYGEPLTYCSLPSICETLMGTAEVAEREPEIEAFNAANKWKKRGLGFTPIKFGMGWNGANYSTQVTIFHGDGSIILSSAGIETGQGINTKLIQVASFVLGAPMDLIRVKETSVLRSANSAPTGGSLTSEMNCKGILECCKILKGRLDGMKEKKNMSATISWPNLIKQCFAAGTNLTAQYWVYNNSETNIQYNNYGSAISEVELDILTGEHVLRRVDILYDCGQSINPDIDIGQVEGAFIMGMGMCTSERIVHDPETGKLLTNSTWEYKPPASKDIPSVWNITLLEDAPCPTGILSSKASGEPPLLSSVSVVFAIKRCIEAFRTDKSYFPIDLPATVDSIQQLCQIDISDYKL